VLRSGYRDKLSGDILCVFVRPLHKESNQPALYRPTQSRFDNPILRKELIALSAKEKT
jgi:hypothetical protein